MASVDEITAMLASQPTLPYKLVKWKDWDHLVGELRNLSRGWIFRGQQSRWELSTTLERYTPPGGKSEQEQRLIREFARRVDRHLSSGQTIKDGLEQLALMQHYGAPTRLLDFTHSPYVAAYFACEEFDEDVRAVWAVHIEPLQSRAGQLLRKAYSKIDQIVKDIPGDGIGDLVSRNLGGDEWCQGRRGHLV